MFPSRLYPLEPIERGTGRVESFAGFVARLAWAHHMQTGRLVMEELLPLVTPTHGGVPRRSPRQRQAPWHSDTRALNGTGDRSAAWVGLLERLTGNEGLQELTVLSWAEIFPPHLLLRRHPGFCARCFQQDLADGQPYERLAWAIDAVDVCLVHRQKLSWACADRRCRRLRPALAPWSLPGYCPWCGRWLGAGDVQVDHADDAPTDPWDFRIASLVDEALAQRPSGDSDSVRRSIEVAIETVACGNRAAFARMIGLRPSSVHAWSSGTRPKLRAVLHVAAVTGSDLTSILEGRPRIGRYPLLILPEHAARERHRHIRWDLVERQITAETHRSNPTSLTAVLRSDGLSRGNLRKVRLVAARVLVEKARVEREVRAQERRNALLARLESTVEDLRARGMAASRRNVESVLGSGVLREHALQERWHQIR